MVPPARFQRATFRLGGGPAKHRCQEILDIRSAVRKIGAPGAIPTRDLPLRSQSKGVYLRYLCASQIARSAGVH